MKGILLRWLANTVAILTTAYLLKGLEVSGLKGAIIAAALWGILNALLRPLLLLLTLPLNILTLGLFTLIVNGFLLFLVSQMTSSLMVHGFWWAVGGAILISLLSGLINWAIE
jgi:putative membrane protein